MRITARVPARGGPVAAVTVQARCEGRRRRAARGPPGLHRRLRRLRRPRL